MIGIYKITNVANNKCYVGQAIDIKNRWNKHKRLLKLNKHYNLYLQNSYNKWGKGNFKFEVIEECDKNELDQKEEYWISKYKSNIRKFGYNQTEGGDGFKSTHSVQTRIKMSKHNAKYWQGKKLSKEIRVKISIAHMGKIPWNKGIKCPWLSGENHPMFGKKHSKESILKMSNSHKGRIVSEETRKKRSEASKGSNNHFYNKKHSESTKQKMRETKLKIFKEKYPKEMANKVELFLNNNCTRYRISKLLNIDNYIIKRIIEVYEL